MSERLTGKRRFRVHKPLFRRPRMILQVQVEGWRTVCHGPCVDTEDYILWRDAGPEDVTEDTQ